MTWRKNKIIWWQYKAMVTVLFWRLAGLGLLVTLAYDVMMIAIVRTGVARVW